MRQFFARHHRKLMYFLAIEGVVIGLVAGTALTNAHNNKNDNDNGCGSNSRRWCGDGRDNAGKYSARANGSAPAWSSADYSRTVQANNSGARGPVSYGWGGYGPDSTPFTPYYPEYPFNGNAQQTIGAAPVWGGGPAPTNTTVPGQTPVQGTVVNAPGGSIGTTGVNGFAPQYPFNGNGQQVSGWTAAGNTTAAAAPQPRQQ